MRKYNNNKKRNREMPIKERKKQTINQTTWNRKVLLLFDWLMWGFSYSRVSHNRITWQKYLKPLPSELVYTKAGQWFYLLSLCFAVVQWAYFFFFCRRKTLSKFDSLDTFSCEPFFIHWGWHQFFFASWFDYVRHGCKKTLA